MAEQVRVVRWRKSSHSGGGGDDCVEAGRVWRKSSHSGGQGECVEVASELEWRKSSHSQNGNDVCVELADAGHVVAVRDSKHPDGGVLTFSRSAWKALAEGL